MCSFDGRASPGLYPTLPGQCWTEICTARAIEPVAQRVQLSLSVIYEVSGYSGQKFSSVQITCSQNSHHATHLVFVRSIMRFAFYECQHVIFVFLVLIGSIDGGFLGERTSSTRTCTLGDSSLETPDALCTVVPKNGVDRDGRILMYLGSAKCQVRCAILTIKPKQTHQIRSSIRLTFR